jgi:hypothetical protein
MEPREQVSQFKQENLDSLKQLDSMTKSILDAIVERQDVFQVHEALMKTLHENTMTKIENTRQEIIGEIKVIFWLVYVYTYSLLETTVGDCRTGTMVGQTA